MVPDQVLYRSVYFEVPYCANKSANCLVSEGSTSCACSNLQI